MRSTVLRPTPWLPLATFAVVFGVLEAAVVVELRRLLDPEGTLFPLLTLPADILWVERLREAGTLVVLGCVAHLSGHDRPTRFSAFLVLFGGWDIVYYAALRVLLGWPPSLVTWDLLFLLPVPWYGPVYAPLAVSVAMLSCGVLALGRSARDGSFPVALRHVAGAVAGGGLLLASFLQPASGSPPERYRVELLVLGLAIGVAAFVDALRTAGPTGLAPAPPPVGASSSAGAPTSTALGRRAPPPRAVR